MEGVFDADQVQEAPQLPEAVQKEREERERELQAHPLQVGLSVVSGVVCWGFPEGRAAFCSFCIALALVVPIKGWQALPSSPAPASWCLEALVLSRSCMWACTALFSPRCSGSCLAAGVTLCPGPCRP